MDNLLSIITFLPLVAAAILALFLRGEDAAAQRNAKWLALAATSAARKMPDLTARKSTCWTPRSFSHSKTEAISSHHLPHDISPKFPSLSPVPAKSGKTNIVPKAANRRP